MLWFTASFVLLRRNDSCVPPKLPYFPTTPDSVTLKKSKHLIVTDNTD